jgi:hypothetical protein
MPRALWQLLLEDPSDLTCEECFAVMEYYAEALTDQGVDLLPKIMEHLERCPDCALQHRQALRRLTHGRSGGKRQNTTGWRGGRRGIQGQGPIALSARERKESKRRAVSKPHRTADGYTTEIV